MSARLFETWRRYHHPINFVILGRGEAWGNGSRTA